MSNINRPVGPKNISVSKDSKSKKLTAKSDFVLLPQVQGGRQLLALAGSKKLHGVGVVLRYAMLEETWCQSQHQLSVISAQMAMGDLSDLDPKLKN